MASHNTRRSDYLRVHFAVFLFGMTGLFGKLLLLSPFIIVLGRVTFSALFLGIWMRLTRTSFKCPNRSDYLKFAAMGALLAIHWVSFFAAIQYATVAIGLLTFSTFPVFVSLFKPILKHERIMPYEVYVGIAAGLGIYCIVPSTTSTTTLWLGAAIGVFSGAVYAIFTTYNEALVRQHAPKTVAFYEQVSAALLLMPFYGVMRPEITGQDWLLLLLLGTVFTGIGHTLFIGGLRGVTAHAAAMITMLEPLYAIALSALTLNEPITLRILLGASILLGAVAITSLKKAPS